VCDAQTPDERLNWNQACNSQPNSCGDINTGLTGCDGLCTAITPDERLNWSKACTSQANSCGDTNAGVTNCDGLCLATIPVAKDLDKDGIADCVDTDLDNDRVLNVNDLCPTVSALGYDANVDGCIDNITGLKAIISSTSMENKLKQSLMLKLTNAENSINRGRDFTAMVYLWAFILQVQSQPKNKKIPQANMIVDYAENVLKRIRL
jgi:hypothetical protein